MHSLFTILSGLICQRMMSDVNEVSQADFDLAQDESTCAN